MKQEIIEMADKADEEADKVLNMKGEYHPNWHQVRDEIFAKLVAAKEREACMEMEKDLAASPALFATMNEWHGYKHGIQTFVSAIRARGEA